MDKSFVELRRCFLLVGFGTFLANPGQVAMAVELRNTISGANETVAVDLNRLKVARSNIPTSGEGSCHARLGIT